MSTGGGLDTGELIRDISRMIRKLTAERAAALAEVARLEDLIVAYEAHTPIKDRRGPLFAEAVRIRRAIQERRKG